MLVLMIDVAEPQREGQVEIVERVACKAWEKIGPHGAEESLDLPFSLGLVGSGMDKGAPQACGDMLQVVRAKGRSVVSVKLPWQPPSG